MNQQVKMPMLLLILAVLAITVPARGAECNSARRASLSDDLSARLKTYLKLREQAKSALPPLTETADSAQLQARQKALANQIRNSRLPARQGDILGDPISTCLSAIVQSHLMKATAKRTLREGNPADEGPGIRLEVNAPYRADAPLSTMPPKLLADLPKLPEGLEYRFVGRALILYDAEAGLIVDYLPGAGA